MTKIEHKRPVNSVVANAECLVKTNTKTNGEGTFFPRLPSLSSDMRQATMGSKKSLETLCLINGSLSISLISTPKKELLPVSVVIGENEPKHSLYIKLLENFTGEQNYSADVIHEGKSIGTLTISDYGDYIWLDHISNLTGKAYRGVGTALQEIIVRYSLTQGYNGKVQLDAKGADSSAFHQHLGYEFLNGTTKGSKGAEQGEMYLPDQRIQQIIRHNLHSELNTDKS